MKLLVNGKEVEVTVSADEICERRSGNKVIVLGDYMRIPTKENYIKEDAKVYYRILGFTTFSQERLVAKCHAMANGNAMETFYPEGHHLAGQPWFYWIPVQEFTRRIEQ